MAEKCVHKGCGKVYTDPEEDCVYHPGPPVFHEGQKGWECCKPRVLTFDEFMTIPPCTTGKHSTTDIPPPVTKAHGTGEDTITPTPNAAPPPGNTLSRVPIAAPQPTATPPPPPPESESDDSGLEIEAGKTCRRRGCNETYKIEKIRDGESCVYHPGAPLFHEGSKGYTCCKRRVLEFSEFMKIEGCETKPRHLFIGSGKKKAIVDGNGEEKLDTVRTDFYQTTTTVIASFFLKKVNKDTAKVVFLPTEIILDLSTTDSPPKRFSATVPLFGTITPEISGFKILGTKLEVNLGKADGASWPVLRSDDRRTGEIIQVGRAGKA